MKLSPTEQKLWEYLLAYETDHAMPPTRMEIATALGYKYDNAGGKQTIYYLLKSMEKKGFIKLGQRVGWRDIKIIEQK